MNRRTIHLEHTDKDVYATLMDHVAKQGVFVTHPGEGLLVDIRYERNHVQIGIPQAVIFEDSHRGEAARYVLGRHFQGYNAVPDLTRKEAHTLSGNTA